MRFFLQLRQMSFLSGASSLQADQSYVLPLPCLAGWLADWLLAILSGLGGARCGSGAAIPYARSIHPESGSFVLRSTRSTQFVRLVLPRLSRSVVMNEKAIREARHLADRLRDLLDASTPGPWAGVSGPDRRRDRGSGRPGAIETEFASGKRVICDSINGPDKAFVLYMRTHAGRIAELLEMLGEAGTESALPAAGSGTDAPVDSDNKAPEAEPDQIWDDNVEYEIDLSMIDDDELDEIEDTLSRMSGKPSVA